MKISRSVRHVWGCALVLTCVALGSATRVALPEERAQDPRSAAAGNAADAAPATGRPAVSVGPQQFTIVLEPVADADVREGIPNQNFGTQPSARVDAENFGPRSYVYLRFDLSAVPVGAQITGATLSMTAYQGYAFGGDGNVYVHQVADDSWVETAITWNNRPAQGSILGNWWLWYNGTPADQIGSTSSAALLAGVIAEHAGDGQFSVMLRSPGYDTEYRTREYGTAAQRPRLTLQVVPALAATNKIYGTLGNAGDLLMTVDPATGVATAIGPTGAGSLPGLAVSPAGEIFATSNSNGSGPSSLYRLDASTGQAFLVGPTGQTYMDAIAFDRDGRLWGFGTSGLSDFFEINPMTGLATFVSSVSEKLVGLACDPIDGTMYASTTTGVATVHDAIYTVSTSTGAITLVGQTGLGGATPDIAFDVAGRLYGVKGGGGGGTPAPNNLIAIDKTTGAGSVIGLTGIDGISGLGSQAFLGQAAKNVLYGSTSGAAGGDLLKIDDLFGTGTLIGNTGIPGVPALAIDRHGNMYGTNRASAVAADLYRIDAATGASYLVGNIGYSYTDAMAFDRDDVLWGLSCTGAGGCLGLQLMRIDPVSATATVIGPVTGNLTGMAFDPDDGTLYGSEGAGGKRIFTLDTATGATTLVGSTGRPDGLTDLAFDVHGQLYGIETVSGGSGGGPGASTLILVNKNSGAGAVVGAIGFNGVSGAASRTYIAPVRTNVIYGTQGNAGDLLVTINPATGVATPVGHTGHALPGLAISPNGRMYATTSSNTVPCCASADLYRLDPETGAAFYVGTTGVEFLDGIAFDDAGRLWGVGNFGGAASTTLYRIVPSTGAVVPIGPNAVHLVGLAFDVTSGRLFGSSGSVAPVDQIHVVNTATGASALVGATGLGNATPDIAFDFAGNMFGVKGGGTGAPNNFIKINPATGAGVIVGPTGINGISGLAAWNFGAALDAPRGVRPVAGTFLEAARPNPFSATTELRFALQREGRVGIDVYSVTGQRVVSLVNGTLSAGEHVVRWSGLDSHGRAVRSGVYYVRMRGDGFDLKRTMVKLN